MSRSQTGNSAYGLGGTSPIVGHQGNRIAPAPLSQATSPIIVGHQPFSVPRDHHTRARLAFNRKTTTFRVLPPANPGPSPSLHRWSQAAGGPGPMAGVQPINVGYHPFRQGHHMAGLQPSGTADHGRMWNQMNHRQSFPTNG